MAPPMQYISQLRRESRPKRKRLTGNITSPVDINIHWIIVKIEYSTSDPADSTNSIQNGLNGRIKLSRLVYFWMRGVRLKMVIVKFDVLV